MRVDPRAGSPSEAGPEASARPALEAQDRLAAAEQRTRELVEQVPAVFYEEEPGPTGMTSYVSPQISELLGVEPSGYIADPNWWADHLHPDDRDRMIDEYEGVLADPEVTSASSEYRLVRPDGRIVWLNDRTTITRDADGLPVLIRGAMFDVTAKRLAEARVSAAEARYRALVEQLPLITYLWEVDPLPGEDPAYYTSPQIGSILGYSPEEWNKDPEGWRELIHPEDRDRIMEAAARSETTGEPFVEEYRYLHGREDRTVWVHDESVLLRRVGEARPWLFQGVMYDITARVEAESRLRAAEEQYRTLVERMPAVTYVWDARATPEDNRNYTSPQIESLLGYTPQEWEIDPDRWQVDLHPDDRERVLEGVARAAETGEPWVAEFRYVHRDGRAVWVHDEAALSSRDDLGRPRLFEGVMFDITDRVETDLLLQASLARFRALAHGAPVGIFETDPEGCCTFVNERWCEAAGMDPTAAEGTGWADALHPDDRERVFTEWASAVADRVEFSSEYRFLHADGEVRWISGRAAAVTDARGIVTGYVGTVDDVTEQRATEEQLRLIRSAVEHTGQAVVIAELGPHGSSPLVFVNPAFTKMTGFDAEEMLGRSAEAMLDGPTERGTIRDRLRSGSEETVEAELLRKDGSRFTAEGVVSPIRNAADEFSHVVGILRDVSGIRRVEADLRESIEVLRHVDSERRQSLAQIVEAQEQELDRMAEGIEDRSLQQMTAVRMRMETLRRNLSDPAQLGALEKLEGSVEQAVGQLRGLLSELRPRELTTEGVEGAVREYLDRVARGMRTEVRGGLEEEPDPSQRATAFRIVQEAVASAVETRRANTILVDLDDEGAGFSVRIVDDGASWRTVRSSTMGDRAGLAGGRCRSFDGPDGATVELWLPSVAPLAGGTPLRPP